MFGHMKNGIHWLAVTGVVALSAPALGQMDVPLGTSFTYQGRLTQGGVPANGAFNFRFELWTSAAGGVMLDNTGVFLVNVTDGLFTTSVNFGTFEHLDGEERWLQVSVEGTPLTPRQRLAPAPYAMQTRGLFVDDDLNVGVGTIEPDALLHVHDGDIWLTGPSATFEMFNFNGPPLTETIQIFGTNAFNGGEIRVNSGVGLLAAIMACDDSQGGLIQARNNNGQTRVQINGEDNNHAGLISILSSAGQPTIQLNADGGDGGARCFMTAADGSNSILVDGEADNGGGLISVRNDLAEQTISLIGDDGDDTGRIRFQDRNGANNFTSLLLDGVDDAGTGSEVLLYDNEGDTATVELNGDNAIGGSETGELTIRETDGSLAFRFLGCDLNLYNAGGASTINWDRCTGTKSAVVATDGFGQRKMYCVEATEVWFEDFGSGQLVDGEARIQLDPMFLQTVLVDESNPLKVFVTLTADCQGVFVRTGQDHFVVKELAGGRSDATFAYRVVAKRTGTEHLRMEEFIDTLDDDAANAPAPSLRIAADDGE